MDSLTFRGKSDFQKKESRVYKFVMIITFVKVLQRHVLSHAVTNCEIASSKHPADRKTLAGKHPRNVEFLSYFARL